MNENKKGVRAPIRTVKTKNPVAKNASAAIGGGAAGAHKDKKRAMKQGDVKHKKQEYAEGLQAKLDTKLAEVTNRHFGPKGAGTELARQTRQAELDRKFNTPAELQKDKDYRDYRAGIKKSKVQVKKNKGVAEGIKEIDMTGKKCTACKKGTYQETGMHDDMDGVLHCTNCNKEITRWQAYKEQGVAEGLQVGARVFNRNEPDDRPASRIVGIINDRQVRVKDGFSGEIVVWPVKDLVKAGQRVAEEIDIPADGTPEYYQFINRGGVDQKTPYDLGGADAYYGRQNDITKEYGFQKGSPEWDEYIQGYRDTYQNKDMRKDYGSSRSAVHPRRITKTSEAMNGITGPGMMLDPASEAEGDAEGLPHLTPELAQHIADQIDSDGAQAIVKSVEWGDGAADELVELIKAALLKIAGTDENGDRGEVNGMSPVSNLMPNEGISAREKWNKASSEREKKHNEIEAKRKAAPPGAGMSAAIDRLSKQVKGEGWTHDSLADRLFEHERTYEEQLSARLARQLRK